MEPRHAPEESCSLMKLISAAVPLSGPVDQTNRQKKEGDVISSTCTEAHHDRCKHELEITKI